VKKGHYLRGVTGNNPIFNNNPDGELRDGYERIRGFKSTKFLLILNFTDFLTFWEFLI